MNRNLLALAAVACALSPSVAVSQDFGAVYGVSPGTVPDDAHGADVLRELRTLTGKVDALAGRLDTLERVRTADPIIRPDPSPDPSPADWREKSIDDMTPAERARLRSEVDAYYRRGLLDPPSAWKRTVRKASDRQPGADDFPARVMPSPQGGSDMTMPTPPGQTTLTLSVGGPPSVPPVAATYVAAPVVSQPIYTYATPVYSTVKRRGLFRGLFGGRRAGCS